MNEKCTNKAPRANRWITLIAIICLLSTSGCLTFTPTPSPTPSPTALPTPTPQPTDTGWIAVWPGVDLRHLPIPIDALFEQLTIVRVDPAAVSFHVHYAPQAPRPVSQWADDLQAPLVINGGYFTPEYQTTGILVSDGQTWGTPYGDFAGMFVVTPEGAASVRWLRLQPYDPTEPLAHALMSFPMLVQPGGVLGFPADETPDPAAQRTVIAQDHQGRILLIAAPRGYLSLHDTARILLETDLEIDSALNLDGGYSTGLWLTSETVQVALDSRVAVPSVLTVTPR